MIGLGISNLIPIIVSIIYSEGPFASLSYIIPGFLSIVMGIVFRKFGSSDNINLKHAMIVSSSIWLWASFIGSLTMVLLVGIKSIDGFNFISGFNFVDGFLESMSAWTTSGHTIFTNVEILPHSLNFLRCFEQWMGGLGIVTLLMGLMLRSGKSTLELYKSEARNEKISPSMGSTLKKIIEVYVFFTIMGILLFIIAGMPIFDSICQTFTQLSTGGAPITSMSMGYYHNNLFNLISIFIMIIGGTSFLTLYKIVKSKGFSFLSDIQFRGMMFLIIIFSILIYFITNMPNIPNMSIMNIVYDVVSAITGTGTSLGSSQDIANFAPFVKISLIVLMIIGPAAGSTGGAVKIIRVIIIIKGLYTQVLEVLSPKDRLIKIKISNQEINDSLIKEA
ncbi:MAG: TrkH family potassium uptake protein, partial [Methanobrevibacter sp.]|nr:TrkH family potassium uptake protein [Methanobrevibacter sp.]